MAHWKACPSDHLSKQAEQRPGTTSSTKWSRTCPKEGSPLPQHSNRSFPWPSSCHFSSLQRDLSSLSAIKMFLHLSTEKLLNCYPEQIYIEITNDTLQTVRRITAEPPSRNTPGHTAYSHCSDKEKQNVRGNEWDLHSCSYMCIQCCELFGIWVYQSLKNFVRVGERCR